MKDHVESVRGMARQWPAVIAESLGLRESEAARAPAAGLPDRDRWESAGFGACWLGQATCLLRLDGRTILTDPNFSERAGVRLFGRPIGRSRSTALPGGVGELPRVDMVVLSHAHLDHWDKPTLRALADHRTVAVIPRRTRGLLPRGFGKVIEVDWEDAREHEGIVLSAVRPAHWGARYVVDAYRGYNAYVIDSGSGDATRGGVRRVVFAGDTAHTGAFDRLSRDVPGVDVVILGIGTYRGWEHRHATPEQAAAMAERMGARLLMPIHHSTFRDPVEPIDEPLERLLSVWSEERVVCARVGESWFGEG